MDIAGARSRVAKVAAATRRRPERRRPVPRQPVTGIVEQFSKRLVAGWVSVPRDHPPLQVSLHLGPLRVASTYTTASPFMSGSQSVLRRADHPAAASPGKGSAGPAAALTHSWQLPNLPGPADDRRNSPEEIRTFSFRVREIWPYVKKRHRITVRVNGEPLPIYGHGMFLNAPRNGDRSLAELRKKLGAGYLLSQYGRIELSKKLDVEWQRKVMALYGQVREVLAREVGYDAFLIGGTLLGAVREGGYIGHDVDFDAAYVSRHTTGPEASAELVRIGLAFVAAGYEVECMKSNLHILRPGDPETRVDLFHVYFDDDGLFAFPWGIAGTSTVRRSDWQGTREIDFAGGRPLVPANAEQMVEHLYGADWRLPKPGFNWHLDRTANAEEGNLSEEQRSELYWANLHAHGKEQSASPFSELVASREDCPGVVVDLGGGDGGDTLGFAAGGRRVLGLDRSAFGVDRARARAARDGLGDRVDFEVCDVSDPEQLDPRLAARLGEEKGPALLYLRLLLCSVTAEDEAALLDVLARRVRPGDVLAAEFRRDTGEAITGSSRMPYRRPLEGAALVSRLRDLSFTVLAEEDATAVPPGEDAEVAVARVVARR